MIDIGTGRWRSILEKVRIGSQDMPPAGAKKVQRSPNGRPVEIRLRFFEIRRSAKPLQSQEDCLENVLRIVVISGDDTRGAVNQLIVFTKNFLNRCDCWWRHLENRSGRHALLDVNIQQEGDPLTALQKKSGKPFLRGHYGFIITSGRMRSSPARKRSCCPAWRSL